jgi:hypothetical protein
MSHKILLYGNSILIAGLASRLRNVQSWELILIADGEAGNLPEVDFVVVDLRDARTPRVLPRLANFQETSLIGLDALTDTVTVLAGKPQQAACMQEMLDLLKKMM